MITTNKKALKAIKDAFERLGVNATNDQITELVREKGIDVADAKNRQRINDQRQAFKKKLAVETKELKTLLNVPKKSTLESIEDAMNGDHTIEIEDEEVDTIDSLMEELKATRDHILELTKQKEVLKFKLQDLYTDQLDRLRELGVIQSIEEQKPEPVHMGGDDEAA